MISANDLRALRLFHDIAPKALDRLAKDMEEKSFEKGDIILNEGDTSGSLYLIAGGAVAVEKKLAAEGNKAKTVARLEAEEFFGEMAFLENQPHSATIRALTKTKLFALPRTALNQLFEKDAKLALDQVLTLLSCVSSRLRSTTNELVSVFEIGRVVGQTPSLSNLVTHVFEQLNSSLGAGVTMAFYRWNQFNDEYTSVLATGPKGQDFPQVLDIQSDLFRSVSDNFVSVGDVSKVKEKLAPLPFSSGHLVFSRSDSGESREGLFFYYLEKPTSFSSGQRQLMETVSAVLAPALVTVRAREEEASRQRLERGRQQGYSL